MKKTLVTLANHLDLERFDVTVEAVGLPAFVKGRILYRRALARQGLFGQSACLRRSG